MSSFKTSRTSSQNTKGRSKQMRNSANLMIATSKKLEPTNENVDASVRALLNQLFEESKRYTDPEDVYVKFLLCECLSCLTNSSEDKATVENNVQYFCEFVQTEMEKAIQRKFHDES